MKEIIKSKWIYIRWFLLRACLILFDIFAVNASIVAALYLRFYVANEFHHGAGGYFGAYLKYALYYTLFCLVIFFAFRMYSSIWRYAGLHDLNRILKSNLICIAGHVLGTVLFFRRMPITVYAISGVLQILLIGASRFSYRLLLMERSRRDEKGQVNTLVVGAGGTAQMALSQIARDGTLKAVCALDYHEDGFTGLMDGLPTVCGIGNLKDAIRKYAVGVVLIASTEIPSELRKKIREICAEANAEAYDYYGLTQNIFGRLTLRELADLCPGPVEISYAGEIRKFADIPAAIREIPDSCFVKTIQPGCGTLKIFLEESRVVRNDTTEEWVKRQEKETGEEISFF